MEIDRLRQINTRLPLVVELSESDPLFAKKKKLLEHMGFDSERHAHIESLSALFEPKDLLELLLQQARVVNFNEVELYFDGDLCDKGLHSNPRNELQALNSLLELIDKSLSGGKCIIKNVMQYLRAEIVDRIHLIGCKLSNEKKTVMCANLAKEKILLNWAVTNGVKTSLEVSYFEGIGRGATAREDLQIGDIALEIPVSIIISDDLVHESDMFHILTNIDGISMETMLLLWTMKEKHNMKSKFKFYFDALPEKFNTGLSFGFDAVMALDGTLLLEEIVHAKEHLRNQYDELFPSLSILHPHVFPSEIYTWEQFLWACELFYSNSMKVIFGDGKPRTCLVPVAGFLNHSESPHVLNYGRLEATTNSLRFPLSRPCRAGEQCFLSYGNFSSSHLLTFYGFLPPGGNPYDIIPLDIDVAQDEVSEDGGTTPLEWRTHMIRGTWFSNNHTIFHYGLPTPLLDHFRRARTPKWQSNSMTAEEVLQTDLDFLENQLSITFQDMMEALGDENLDDRESTCWDVKLALEFKNLQRKIISSILTSCATGCHLLKCELSKSTH